MHENLHFRYFWRWVQVGFQASREATGCFVLANGADPDSTHSVRRLVLMAVTFGQPRSVVKTLLQAHANVNAHDRNGRHLVPVQKRRGAGVGGCSPMLDR